MSVADTTSASPEASTDVRPFEPVLGDRFVLAWPHLLLTCWFCGFFLILSHLPLIHTELWGHISVGNQIMQSGGLPQSEPTLSLAAGMPFITPAWLSQILLASVNNIGGPDALSGLSGLLQLAMLVAFGVAIYFRTTQKRYVLAATVGLIATSCGFAAVLRPQVFGGVCFAVLLLMLALLPQWNGFASKAERKKGEWPLWLWFAVPALFAIWSNLDISFISGLLVLVCVATGRVIDVTRKTGSLLATLLDRQSRRMVLLAELAAFATLLNPYGWDLWGYAVGNSANAFWLMAGGWRPLALASWTGVGFAAIWFVAIFCIRFAKASIRTEEVLLLATFSIAVAINESLFVWFAPVAGFVLLPRLREVFESLGVYSLQWVQSIEASAIPAQASVGRSDRKPLRFAYTLCSVLVVWIAFALSPISNPLFGGDSRSPEHQFNAQTPLGVSEFLSQRQSDKLAWTPGYWGDFLALHATTDAGYFANSNIRVLPAQAQLDFDHIRRAGPGTERLLNRYDIGVVVVDIARQSDLAAVMKAKTSDWRLAYQDDQAVVYIRRANEITQPKSPVSIGIRSSLIHPLSSQLVSGGSR